MQKEKAFMKKLYIESGGKMENLYPNEKKHMGVELETFSKEN